VINTNGRGLQGACTQDFDFFLIKAPREDVERFLVTHAFLTKKEWSEARSTRDQIFPDLNICYGNDLVQERLYSHKEESLYIDVSRPLCVCTQLSVVRSNKDFMIIENGQACYPLLYQAMQSVVSQFLGTFVMLVRSLNKKRKDQGGALIKSQNMFSVHDWSGEKPDHYNLFDMSHSRSVDVWLDERWRFEQHGTPLFFENEKYYRKKRIKDRLNQDILREYLWKLDVDLEGILTGRELNNMTVITSDEIGTPIEPSARDIDELDAFTACQQ